MGQIYKIENNINHRIYIGLTTKSALIRWREHLDESKRNLHKELYKAIRDFGEENFNLEIIEEVEDEELLWEREEYWIQYYNCIFPNGYNMNRGGQLGRHYNYKEIVDYYLSQDYISITDLAKHFNIHRETAAKALNSFNIQTLSNGKSTGKKKAIPIYQYDKKGNFLKGYNSTIEAARALGKENSSSTLTKVADKRGRSAWGFLWSKYRKENFFDGI